MSRNISLLSGKKDDKNSLFGKISVSPNETTDAQLAGEYNLGVSTIHSTKSFYDFLSEDFVLSARSEQSHPNRIKVVILLGVALILGLFIFRRYR